MKINFAKAVDRFASISLSFLLSFFARRGRFLQTEAAKTPQGGFPRANRNWCGDLGAFCKGLAYSPCLLAADNKRSPCRDNQHMKTIPVGEVCAEVMKVLL